MYQMLQSLLPEFTIEPVTIDNLSDCESVFYNNREYYYLTDGQLPFKCSEWISGLVRCPCCGYKVVKI